MKKLCKYLIDDNLNNEFIEIKNEWGDPEGWLFDEWDGGSTKIQAVESLDDGGYIIAIKRENTDFWSGQTNVDWETVQLNYEGKSIGAHQLGMSLLRMKTYLNKM